jgi:hypothetical protein
MLLGDLVILTEKAGEVAACEKDIARTLSPAHRRLFIEKGLKKSHGCLRSHTACPLADPAVGLTPARAERTSLQVALQIRKKRLESVTVLNIARNHQGSFLERRYLFLKRNQ